MNQENLSVKDSTEFIAIKEDYEFEEDEEN